MNWMANLATGLKALLQKHRIERELDEELDSYLEASVEHKQRTGMSLEAARRAAVVEVGSRSSVKHQVWSSRWESTLDGLLQDTRLSLRTLAKSPGFTAVALLSLALGIGGNTAIFTLIHQVLLRNLPVHDARQLVSFGRSSGGGVLGGVDLGAHGVFPWDFARHLQSDPGPFQGIASYCSFSNQVSVRFSSGIGDSRSNPPAVLVPASLVSGNYFRVLGAEALMGRTLNSADDATPGSGAVVVVSHYFWQQSLSSDSAVLGKTIGINGTPFEIVGVMPEAFAGIKQEVEPAELWTPTSMQTVVLQQPTFLTPTGPYFLNVFGRLSSEATTRKAALAQSQAWLDQQIRTAMRAKEGTHLTPNREQEISRITVPLISATHGISAIRERYGDSLQILMWAVVLVLLIACANLANFLLARATLRQREIATRLALGSSRARIARQSLIETLLLSLMSGVLGLGIAFATTRALIAFVSQGNANVTMDPKPDAAVLLFTLGVSFLTALLFGLAPAIAAARCDGTGSLSDGSRMAMSSGGRSARFWPKALVTAQVMLSLLLLVGAGLFLHTLRNLENQDYGFERTHLLLANFNPRLVGYKPSQTPGLHQQMLERISALPGVKSAALALTPPINLGGWSSSLTIPGYTPVRKINAQSMLNRVSGQYFETAGIAIVAGRSIDDDDSLTRQKVAVINQTVAKTFFPNGDAIGRQIQIDIDSVKGPWKIVGIARDTRSGDPRNTDPQRMVYVPLAQIEPFEPVDPSAPSAAPAENQDRFAGVILLRTIGDPKSTIADFRDAMKSIDSNLPLTEIGTIREQVASFIANDKLISTLTGAFAVLALFLASIGLYGVMSYNVARRTGELGVRLALGAQAGSLRWMIFRESLLLLAVGTGLGSPLSLAAARLLHQQLFGLSTVDAATFAVAISVVSVMTLLAAWLPARRATRVDPMVALRSDQ